MSQSSTATLPNVIPQHRITLTFPSRLDASVSFFMPRSWSRKRSWEWEGRFFLHQTALMTYKAIKWSVPYNPPPTPTLPSKSSAPPPHLRVFEMNRINYQSAIWFVISPSAAHVWTQTFIQTLEEKLVLPSVSTSHKHNTAARAGFHFSGGPELETVQSRVCIKHANCQYIKTVEIVWASI